MRDGSIRKWRVMSWLIAAAAVCLAAAGPVTAAGGASDPAAERLGRAISFQTLSNQDKSLDDPAPFKAMQDFIKTSYPLIHSHLTREEVGLSVLYTWKGSDPALKPIVFLGHQDVVPIAPGTMKDWTVPPFEGRVQDGFIWGRGAMDMKGIMMAVLEAMENLLAAGYQPRRTIYLAFGHDEEVGGTGAIAMAELLKSRGVTAEFVLDESGLLLDGKVLGLKQPVAVIGVAEKGYLSLEIIARAKGGHSSTPTGDSAIAKLAAALLKVQHHKFPARLSGGVTSMTFKALGPEMPGVLGFAIKNQWLFGGLIQSVLAKQAATDAMIRTTTAITIINAGTKENVLPQEAKAVVNFRLLPGDDIAYVTETIRKVIDDPKIEIKPVGTPREASNVSRTDSPGWALVTGTIKQLFPEAAQAPYLCLGGTDSRHYDIISDSVYRFAPMRATAEDQERAHGTNERLAVENYKEMIEFYEKLVKNSDK